MRWTKGQQTYGVPVGCFRSNSTYILRVEYFWSWFRLTGLEMFTFCDARMFVFRPSFGSAVWTTEGGTARVAGREGCGADAPGRVKIQSPASNLTDFSDDDLGKSDRM